MYKQRCICKMAERLRTVLQEFIYRHWSVEQNISISEGLAKTAI